jgi:hypothetical protein
MSLACLPTFLDTGASPVTVVLLGLVTSVKDLLVLDFHGFPVSSLWVVRPHGEQTLKAGKTALGVSPQTASAYADWVVDPNTALRMAPNALVSQALLPLRCAGQATALNVVVSQILPANGNAGSDSFTADLCGEIKAQLASRTEQFTKFLAWRQQAPESVAVPAALVLPSASVFDAPPAPTTVDALYHRLLDTLPDDMISVPLVLHCMFEQIEFHSELQNELVTLAEHQLNLQRASLVESPSSAEGADAAPPPPAVADGYVTQLASVSLCVIACIWSVKRVGAGLMACVYVLSNA